MLHSIDPVAFSLFGSPITWYWLFYPIGFLSVFAITYFYMKAEVEEKSTSNLIDFFLLSWLGIILGGRLGYFLLYQWDLTWQKPELLFAFELGGMSFHGAVLGLCLSLYLFHKISGRKIFYYSDRILLFTPIALFMGRMGNFINGELWGRPSNLPWAMIFPSADSLSRHPSQVYQAIAEGPLLFLLMWLLKKTHKNHYNTYLFVILYSVLRFITEFFREPDAHIGYIFHNFTYGQLLSAIVLVVFTALLIRLPKTKS